MSTEMQTKMQASPAQSFIPVQTGLLQRKSALCNTPGLVEDSGRDKEKLTLQRSSVYQAGTTTVPRFGHDFSRVRVHSTGPGMIQTKLKINEPGDIYEQEADRVAEQVMRMSEPGVHREVEPEEETLQSKPLAGQIVPLVQRQPADEEEEEIQTKPLAGQTPEVIPAISSGIQSLQGGGRPLSGSERSFFEPRFGKDFSNVRVHNDMLAASVTRSVNARAFTHGRNVVFGAGEFSSNTLAGRKLLAHELTHVVQQNGGPTLFSTGKNSENTIPTSQGFNFVYPEYLLAVQQSEHLNIPSIQGYSNNELVQRDKKPEESSIPDAGSKLKDLCDALRFEAYGYVAAISEIWYHVINKKSNVHVPPPPLSHGDLDLIDEITTRLQSAFRPLVRHIYYCKSLPGYDEFLKDIPIIEKYIFPKPSSYSYSETNYLEVLTSFYEPIANLWKDEYSSKPDLLAKEFRQIRLKIGKEARERELGPDPYHRKPAK